MLRPVRPCVPVSAGMGCARSPLQSGRASWTVLCRSPEHLHARLPCLLLRLSSKDRAVPPSLLAPAYGAAFRRTG